MVSFLGKLAGIKEEGIPITNVNTETVSVNNFVEEMAGKAEQAQKQSANGKDWLEENYEGQLSVDVYGTEDEVVIKSTIAGVKSEDIDISIHNDMLTIRGERTQETEQKIDESYYQECYWGGFSRSIILPVEVDSDRVSANLKNGVLTIRLPKTRKTKSISIKVKEE